jgi:UDP-N-acetylmuramate dehydrogenase
MPSPNGTPLAALTTLRVGGPARRLVEAATEADLVEAVDACDRDGEPVLLVGGGSNLVVADEGFPGTVVLIRTSGVQAQVDDCSGATVRVAAGEDWDALVAHTVAQGWAGVEALSGIPGCTGATPVQNVGAYGQEVAQTIASVRVWDRAERRRRTFAAADCGFAYRHSRFKAEPSRWVVLEVTFQLRPAELSEPVRYAELARTLGVEVGARAPLPALREAVLGLRRGKGMVLDADDPDTWSAGSFFTNPVVDPALVPDGAPAWPQPDGRVKTSAAWLIERAGFGKGYGGPAASLSTKHTLALTNRGDARAEDLLGLAREVRDGVRDAFGITLVNEPVLVGLEL